MTDQRRNKFGLRQHRAEPTGKATEMMTESQLEVAELSDIGYKRGLFGYLTAGPDELTEETLSNQETESSSDCAILMNQDGVHILE